MYSTIFGTAFSTTGDSIGRQVAVISLFSAPMLIPDKQKITRDFEKY